MNGKISYQITAISFNLLILDQAYVLFQIIAIMEICISDKEHIHEKKV